MPLIHQPPTARTVLKSAVSGAVSAQTSSPVTLPYVVVLAGLTLHCIGLVLPPVAVPVLVPVELPVGDPVEVPVGVPVGDPVDVPVAVPGQNTGPDEVSDGLPRLASILEQYGTSTAVQTL